IVVLEIQKDAEISDAGTVTILFDNGTKSKAINIVSVTSFMETVDHSIDKAKIQVSVLEPTTSKTSIFISLVPNIIIIIVFVAVVMFLFQQMQGGGGSKVMNFGKSRAKLVNDDKARVTFDKVAGLHEEKEDLEEIVEFLKAPKKFVDIGARIPKGVLLEGPPGTGKTLLAKAVAGEAGVPFFSISGSDFVEMFVGVGASRVRDLFEQAKKNTPCLVFIDEIDAVGRRRGAGLGGGHDEREQTLNQLLVEMDGFGVNEGVIVLAATNRPDILDPALLRPGRFDRQITVGKPDVRGREEILNVHAKTKKIADDVDLQEDAKTTPGFTGADLENLLNESALLAARENKKALDDSDIRKAFVKVAMGTEKKSRVITDKEKKITAYHEAGHAILHELLPEVTPVHMISIIPVGHAGGYTMPVPEEKSFVFKAENLQEIMCLFGGRIAEKLIFNDITAGASHDIEVATSIARSMVMKFGMSEKLGPILFGENSHDVFLGRDINSGQNFSEETSKIIDEEINSIIVDCYNKAEKLLSSNLASLHDTAKRLMEKEKITGDEFREILRNNNAPIAEKNSEKSEETITE
ncbi:MAG: ATP-dependent zinc metalloprotease FtsH, partial [Firmicutes bacterium]|nr:ATP-dependent zinc metalloprotease FtsH [Bacillota bacterium]